MMGQQKPLWLAMMFTVLLASWSCSPRTSARPNPSASVTPFLGRWDLTVKTAARAYPSWIDVTAAGAQPQVLVVGFAGAATHAVKASVANGTIEFSMPTHVDYYGPGQFTGKLANRRLEGTASGPNGATWPWTGRRAPALSGQTVSKWGKPIRLFNGRNFAGWKFADPSQAKVWRVEHHLLVKNGSGSELISTAQFSNFKLHVEFNAGPDSNSGVYLRGRYEVQIETNSGSAPADQQEGAIYGFLTPHPAQPRRANVWQTYDITLVGRTVTVVQNGTTIIDHQQIPGITGGALNSNEGTPGPIYLQGSEAGRVEFRNIVITPALLSTQTLH